MEPHIRSSVCCPIDLRSQLCSKAVSVQAAEAAKIGLSTRIPVEVKLGRNEKYKLVWNVSRNIWVHSWRSMQRVDTQNATNNAPNANISKRRQIGVPPQPATKADAFCQRRRSCCRRSNFEVEVSGCINDEKLRAVSIPTWKSS